MFQSTQKILKRLIFLIFVLSFNQTYAQTAPLSIEEIVAQLEKATPSIIGNENSKLVIDMMGARLGKPISDGLNIKSSISKVFGRRLPKFDPDCSRKLTESGDISHDLCTASSGDKAGGGAYLEFSWSKSLDLGSVKYLRRDADGSIDPANIPPVKLSDDEAYNKAITFLNDVMGVPMEEIPVAPTNAVRRLPVRTLAVGQIGPKGEKNVVGMAKVVNIPRGLMANIKDPASGRELPYLPAPGRAIVVLNDLGVLQANVQNWSNLEKSAMVDPKNAKSRDDLIKEIAESMLQKNLTKIGKISVVPVISSLDPKLSASTNDDKHLAGLLLPAVQVFVSVTPRDPSEDEQNRSGPDTAGFAETFALVDFPTENAPDDDDN
ncbi:MAG: hypothetical protein M0R33_17970 [Methylomonas sp.]|jgi:hypothetical protein|uniref:hypothetical protein n=1 Tax=Methylomonas sp. TaxID=418 RepID=UPI0025F32387|nr:hypothetical protein [Methylomonas sp.]MCK9608336.1 hypothetical protein [Methylomonas sp.]